MASYEKLREVWTEGFAEGFAEGFPKLLLEEFPRAFAERFTISLEKYEERVNRYSVESLLANGLSRDEALKILGL